MALLGQAPGRLLPEGAPLGRHRDDARAGAAEAFDGLEEGLGLHQHARAAAVGLVVQRAAGVVREVAQVHGADVGGAHGRRATQDALPEEALQHPREDRHHVDAQRHRRRSRAQASAGAAAAAFFACFTSEATVSETCAPWLTQ